MTSLLDLLADLAAAPRLPGASCRGHAELFDRTTGKSQAVDTREARTAALALCQACPTLHGCRAWLDSLPPDQRPLGVVAGQVVAEDKTTSGFQRERAERDAHIVKLHAAGLTNQEIVAATGHSKSTVRRALTTPKGPQPMTAPQPADNRRATALVVHYGNHVVDGHNLEGINAILAEAVETTRITPLFVAVLELHESVIPMLFTTDGLACVSVMVYTLANDADADTTRAAQLITAHSKRDVDAFDALMRQAADASRVTELLMAVLAVYRTVVPQLYCELGLQVLERSILDWAVREDGSQ